MFKWLESRVLWGGLLIVGGILYLLQNLGITRLGGLFWGIVLVLGGLFFLGVYLSNRVQWWALIPGSALLAAGLVNILQVPLLRFTEIWGGLIVLGGIGFAFLLIYWTNPANWWALIPAGVLLTIGLVSVVDNLNVSFDSGGLFMIGLGLTFALVALLPQPGNRMRWAWIPAVIFLLIGVLITFSAEASLNILGPLLLIIAGGYLLLRTFRPRMS